MRSAGPIKPFLRGVVFSGEACSFFVSFLDTVFGDTEICPVLGGPQTVVTKMREKAMVCAALFRLMGVTVPERCGKAPILPQ